MTKAISPFQPLTLERILDHQRWLSSNGQFGERLVDWFLSFDHLNLDGLDLSGAVLACSIFEGGSFRSARFVGTELQGAIFLCCDIEGANFTHANVAEAIFLTDHTKALHLDNALHRENAAFGEEATRQRQQKETDELKLDREDWSEDWPELWKHYETERALQRSATRPQDVKRRSSSDQKNAPHPKG